jgi:hypothetical protein
MKPKKEASIGLRTQQNMIQLADPFQPLFQCVIVGQPAFHLLLLLRADTNLLVPAARIVDRKYQRRMPLPTGTPLTTALMPDGALQQGSAQNLGRRFDRPRQFVPLPEDIPLFHLLR